VCFAGTVDGLRASDTLTGRHLGYWAGLKPDTRKPTGRLEIRSATRHNLRNVNVDVPLGVLCVVTGVAGSAKSSLIQDLAMMAGVATVCEECEGKRFKASVLEYKLGGRDISQVLAMSVTEALEFFGGGKAKTPAARNILGRMADVGLGYLRLGQPLTTLSGRERQRLKLAIQMATDGGIYVLDEPTSGLHVADVEQLLELLDRLVVAGKSVIVIEHHLAVMAHADWMIDLGPGAGHDGGRWCSRARPRIWSPPPAPSPANISRRTSPDHAR
jgi:excinuclease UvrABC ATPase subunit